MAMQQAPYPVHFSVDYPDRPLNRLTTAFRIFVAIPILIVLGTVSGGTWQWQNARGCRAQKPLIVRVDQVFLRVRST
jgi:hypothetical protein